LTRFRTPRRQTPSSVPSTPCRKADVATAAVNAVPDANKADVIRTAIKSAPEEVGLRR
jgi:hypothetical protein